MAGALIPPSPVAGLDAPAGSTMSPSAVNSFRIAAVTERLALHVLTPPKNDAVEFFNLCLSLARFPLLRILLYSYVHVHMQINVSIFAYSSVFLIFSVKI
ncbi:hypothetical protein Acr_14g0009640 [Actinidia rufa]|uniref:Uncharacterized protein n=1 Tax=Actinidia rufa TaxID=165716 RepID=A0A7J0FRI6_9ERIC|nr:hypothetical protein Acr_14g0009640 [Actinidia rufa]